MSRAKRVIPSEHIRIQPWSAAGPGWANSGVYAREPLDTGDGECIYVDQLGPQAYALFSVTLCAMDALKRAICREGYRKSREVGA